MKRIIIFSIFATLFLVSPSLYAFASDTQETSVLTDKKPSRKKGETKEVTFHVHLHCNNCVKKVQDNIGFEKGVKDLEVSLEEQTVRVKFDASKTSESVLKAAIEKLGYETDLIQEQVPGNNGGN
ncbi:MAG: heavy-metal-associated domain-containing protein [Bacteroidales bacterium]|nr:heavy-metal-associated domain-containing protein [Bacteroidales bacterium]